MQLRKIVHLYVVLLLVFCQLLIEVPIFFRRSGRAKRNPTRIDYVYYVGFRFALPDLQNST